jgi:type III secretion protein D
MSETQKWRVVAGPNIGASLSLGAGRTVIGSGDEADIILGDKSIRPSHLELAIASLKGGEFKVVAKPLEGPVLLDGQEVPEEGSEVKPDQVLSMGLTALAYKASGGGWEGVQLVPLAYAKALVPEAAAPSAAPPSLEDDKSASEPPEEAAPVVGRGPEETPEPKKEKAPEKPKKPRLGLLSLLLALLAVILLIFGPAGQDSGVQEEDLRTLLDANGFEELEVSRFGGALEASGELESDSELSRLVDLIKGQPAKVFLRISVRRDLLEAARQALTAYGFYPSVYFDADHTPTVAVYMLNRDVEEAAFETLARDVPSLDPARKVVYRDALEPVLRQELSSAGVGEAKIAWREGWLELAPSGPAEANAYARAFKLAASRTGVPVVYTLSEGGLSGESEPEVAAAPQPAVFEPPSSVSPPALAAASGDPFEAVDVVGVTMVPMRFVSTRDGQKLFEGSPLPGGWTISAIDSQSLTLTRRDETVIIELGPS